MDKRALNRVTERRYFVIPNADRIKTAATGSKCIRVGDLKEGSNEVDKEPGMAAQMVGLAASGCDLPRGPCFGPTNGLEDFREIVLVVLGRRLDQECCSLKI